MSGKGLILMLVLLGAVLYHVEASGRSEMYMLLIYCYSIKLCLVVYSFVI